MCRIRSTAVPALAESIKAHRFGVSRLFPAAKLTEKPGQLKKSRTVNPREEALDTALEATQGQKDD